MIILLLVVLPAVNVISALALNAALLDNGYPSLPVQGFNGLDMEKQKEVFHILWMCARSDVKAIRFWFWLSLINGAVFLLAATLWMRALSK